MTTQTKSSNLESNWPMTDDQHPKSTGLNLSTPEMKALLDGIADMASRTQEPDAFQLMMTHPQSIPPMLKCGHNGQWGREPFAPGASHPIIHGVEVVTSEHIPPGTMILLSRPDAMRPDWPPPALLSMDSPKDGFNHHAQDWSLLQTIHHQLINTNRGRFNTIIVADESPIIPERPHVCWTCGQTFMSRRMVGVVRQCDACATRFRRAQFTLNMDLQSEYEIQLYCEIKRLGKSWPTRTLSAPFRSTSQARAAAQKAKAKKRRAMLRERRLTKRLY